jgi:hypothetical protein
MKSVSTSHAYDQYRREHPDKQTSEGWRIRQAEHFLTKFNPAVVFKMTPEEKAELKTRMYSFPNKNHTPVGYNRG